MSSPAQSAARWVLLRPELELVGRMRQEVTCVRLFGVEGTIPKTGTLALSVTVPARADRVLLRCLKTDALECERNRGCKMR